jgi:hypothetical protein
LSGVATCDRLGHGVQTGARPGTSRAFAFVGPGEEEQVSTRNIAIAALIIAVVLLLIFLL